MSAVLAKIEELFSDEDVRSVPPLEDRYEYKKEPGDADARNTEDVIKT